MLRKALPKKHGEIRRMHEQEAAITESLSRVRRPGFANAAVLDSIDEDDLDDIVDEDDIVDQSPEPEEEEEKPVVKKAPKVQAEDPAPRSVIKRASLRIDPGPDPKTVPFGLNCGSCKKFVKLDDPRRDDPEWLLAMSKKKDRCPLMFATEDYDLTTISTEELSKYIATADRPECEKFVVNDAKCSPELIEVITKAREALTLDELLVFNFMATGIEKLKASERRHGYRIGETVEVYEGDKTYKSKVIDFQRRSHMEVIVQTLNRPGKQVKMCIPARRASVMHE